jgi:quaternary ammonium compound-resistance protein SugE
LIGGPNDLFAKVEDDLSYTTSNVQDGLASRGGLAVSWVLLFCAGLLEIAWAYFMKRSAGFTLLWPSVLTITMMFASFALLAVSMKTLPLGTAYTIWTGAGAVGAFVVGIAVLGEAATPMRLLGAGFIVSGIVMMKLSGSD